MSNFGRLFKGTKQEWKKRPEVLLCPQIPAPMHGVAPRVIMGDAWWNKVREAAYASTNYHCIACGVHKVNAQYHQWLEGHEIYEINYEKGLMKYVETVPLCTLCHNYIHTGRLQALLEAGRIHHAKCVAIIKHGDRVLREAGLKKPPLYNGRCAKWQDWRLQIGAAKYPPKFKSEKEWLEHFSVTDAE
jgi:hypothetical protein